MLLRLMRSDWGPLFGITLVVVVLVWFYSRVVLESVFCGWLFCLILAWPIVWKVYDRSLNYPSSDLARRRLLLLRSVGNLVQITVCFVWVVPTLWWWKGTSGFLLCLAVVLLLAHGYFVVRNAFEFLLLLWFYHSSLQNEWL